MTRVGPPALAAAADGCGLVSSAVLPLCVRDRAVGVLQLLGTRESPIDARHVDRLGPLPAVLAARLVDMAALTSPAEPAPSVPPTADTTSGPTSAPSSPPITRGGVTAAGSPTGSCSTT